MKEEKVDFDLSVLSLKELIQVYGEMSDFIQFLKDNKIVVEEAKSDE